MARAGLGPRHVALPARGTPTPSAPSPAARSAVGGRWCGGCACWVSWARAARRMRETCICEQPTRWPISAWVRSSRKRRRTASASRSDSVASRPSSVAVASAAAKPGSSAPSRSASVAASSPSSGEWPVEESLPRAGRLRRLRGCLRSCSRAVGRARLRSDCGGARGELVALAGDADGALLEVAGWADGPGEVAEVAPDLALDGRHGEGAEGRALAGVKAIHRLDQTQCRDLSQILERHPLAAIKTPRDRVGERKIRSNQALTRRGVAVLREARKSVGRIGAHTAPRRRGARARRESKTRGHGTDVLPGAGFRQTRRTRRG